MLSYCLKCRKSTESKNTKAVKTKNERVMPLSKCSVCDSKKSKFIKEQELLSSLGIRTPLSQIPFLGPPLFWKYKMNEIMDKFLLAGDKFMPEMHFKQSDLHIVLIDHSLKIKKK